MTYETELFESIYKSVMAEPNFYPIPQETDPSRQQFLDACLDYLVKEGLIEIVQSTHTGKWVKLTKAGFDSKGILLQA